MIKITAHIHSDIMRVSLHYFSICVVAKKWLHRRISAISLITAPAQSNTDQEFL